MMELFRCLDEGLIQNFVLNLQAYRSYTKLIVNGDKCVLPYFHGANVISIFCEHTIFSVICEQC